MSFAEITTPLWICPNCKRRFVTRNTWHACSQHELDEHFADKPPRVRELYDAWQAFVEKHGGPVTVIPHKTRINFQARACIGGAVVHKNWLEANLYLQRAAAHALFTRIQRVTERDQVYTFKLTDESELDKALAALVKEAYRGGLQEK